MSSTKDWKYSEVAKNFGEKGCSIGGCSYNHPKGCASAQVLCCALNLSNAVIEAGYKLPGAKDVNLCNHAGSSQKRVRNADGMARVIRAQSGGKIGVSGWANRPNWKGIVFFEGGLALTSAYDQIDERKREQVGLRATGHIDLWDGKKGVHAEYPDAAIVWFWQLG